MYSSDGLILPKSLKCVVNISELSDNRSLHLTLYLFMAKVNSSKLEKKILFKLSKIRHGWKMKEIVLRFKFETTLFDRFNNAKKRTFSRKNAHFGIFITRKLKKQSYIWYLESIVCLQFFVKLFWNQNNAHSCRVFAHMGNFSSK